MSKRALYAKILTKKSTLKEQSCKIHKNKKTRSRIEKPFAVPSKCEKLKRYAHNRLGGIHKAGIQMTPPRTQLVVVKDRRRGVKCVKYESRRTCRNEQRRGRKRRILATCPVDTARQWDITV